MRVGRIKSPENASSGLQMSFNSRQNYIATIRDIVLSRDSSHLHSPAPGAPHCPTPCRTPPYMAVQHWIVNTVKQCRKNKLNC